MELRLSGARQGTGRGQEILKVKEMAGGIRTSAKARVLGALGMGKRVTKGDKR